MSRSGGTTLYVTGFGQGTRARDLAYEFERYGRLVRCDIPAPRTASSRLFAFVEYESRRDADDAYYEMHGRRIRDDILKIEWARTPPSASWRFEGGRDGPRGGGGGGGGGGRRSPRRGSARSVSPRGRRGDDRAPLSPPAKSRDRSRSPVGKEDLDGDRDMNRGSPRDDHDRDDRRRSSDRDAKDSPPLHDDLDTADAE